MAALILPDLLSIALPSRCSRLNVCVHSKPDMSAFPRHFWQEEGWDKYSQIPGTPASPESPVQKLESKAHRGAAQRLDPALGELQQCIFKGRSCLSSMI